MGKESGAGREVDVTWLFEVEFELHDSYDVNDIIKVLDEHCHYLKATYIF